MADRYTHGHHESVLRSHRWRSVANSAAYLAEHLRPGMTLLDVGCGPGSLTADLARRLAPGRVVGLDASSDVLAEAAGEVEGLPNVELARGDAYALPFSAASFDAVHAHQVLQHLARPVEGLKEMARVCRPGGVVAVRDADYGGMRWWPAECALDRWSEIYQAAARANGAHPDAGRKLLSWAHKAGLEDVAATASVWCYSTPDSRRWWGGLWAERIVASDLARQATEHGLATVADLEEIAAGWLRWAAAPDGWFVVVHGEVVARPE